MKSFSFFCVCDQSILLSEVTSSIFFSISNEKQEKIIITHTHKQNVHKKKRRRRRWAEMNETTNKQTKIADGKNTRINIHTRMRAYTWKGYESMMMMIKTRQISRIGGSHRCWWCKIMGFSRWKNTMKLNKLNKSTWWWWWRWWCWWNNMWVMIWWTKRCRLRQNICWWRFRIEWLLLLLLRTIYFIIMHCRWWWRWCRWCWYKHDLLRCRYRSCWR